MRGRCWGCSSLRTTLGALVAVERYSGKNWASLLQAYDAGLIEAIFPIALRIASADPNNVQIPPSRLTEILGRSILRPQVPSD